MKNHIDMWLYWFGLAVIILGIFIGFNIVSTLKEYSPGLTEGYTYDDPHPLRWPLALISIIFSTSIGLVLIGLSKLIENQEESNSIQNNVVHQLKQLRE